VDGDEDVEVELDVVSGNVLDPLPVDLCEDAQEVSRSAAPSTAPALLARRAAAITSRSYVHGERSASGSQ